MRGRCVLITWFCPQYNFFRLCLYIFNLHILLIESYTIHFWHFYDLQFNQMHKSFSFHLSFLFAFSYSFLFFHFSAIFKNSPETSLIGQLNVLADKNINGLFSHYIFYKCFKHGVHCKELISTKDSHIKQLVCKLTVKFCNEKWVLVGINIFLRLSFIWICDVSS
jgi:hypothetical protein